MALHDIYIGLMLAFIFGIFVGAMLSTFIIIAPAKKIMNRMDSKNLPNTSSAA